jgi:hypothetical protein
MVPHHIPSEGRTWFVPRMLLTDLKVQALRAEQQTDFLGQQASFIWCTRGAALQVFHRESSEPPHHAGRVSNCLASRCTPKGAGAEGRQFPRSQFPGSTRPPLRRSSHGIPRVQEEASSSPLPPGDDRNITNHFTWPKALDKITHHDVASAIEKIEAPSEANHAFKDIRTFFNWRVPRHPKYSPCTGPEDAQRGADQVSRPDGRTTEGRLASDRPNRRTLRIRHFGSVVKLLILTGQRWGEIAALRAGRMQDATIVLPQSLTKNGREHCFPIGSTAQSIISAARLPSSAHRHACLFPARGKPGHPFNGWSKAGGQKQNSRSTNRAAYRIGRFTIFAARLQRTSRNAASHRRSSSGF